MNMKYKKYKMPSPAHLFLLFLSGISTGLSFAPIYFTPGIFGISYLLHRISLAETPFKSFKEGYVFGVGFFLSTLYWIAFGVSVYIDEFWWAIPFALLGLPCFLALFTGFVSLFTTISKIKFSDSKLYKIFNLHIGFCVFWLIYEIVSESLLTGLPWALLGYSLSFSLPLMQTASITGIFGLSGACVYVASSFYSRDGMLLRLIISCLIIGTMFFWGQHRLISNPTEYTEIKARIVQASIPQSDKWNTSDIWDNIDKHLDLSKTESTDNIADFGDAYETTSLNNPDIIIWPEAALVIPYYYSHDLMDEILQILNHDNESNTPRLLITGAATDNRKAYDSEDFEIYSSMLGFSNRNFIRDRLPSNHSSNNDSNNGVSKPGDQSIQDAKANSAIYKDAYGNSLYLAFEYHKSHLVPFGEYIPLKSILPPIKKITPGLVDYTQGNFELVKLKINAEGPSTEDSSSNKLNITIQPQICYESIFSSQMRKSNKDVDLIINITNDAWYGNSSGPYQHFEIARIRAIENGLPMIRAANNGISAFIDPMGRVLDKLELNEVGVLDSFIPKKLHAPTYFSIYNRLSL